MLPPTFCVSILSLRVPIFMIQYVDLIREPIPISADLSRGLPRIHMIWGKHERHLACVTRQQDYKCYTRDRAVEMNAQTNPLQYVIVKIGHT